MISHAFDRKTVGTFDRSFDLRKIEMSAKYILTLSKVSQSMILQNRQKSDREKSTSYFLLTLEFDSCGYMHEIDNWLNCYVLVCMNLSIRGNIAWDYISLSRYSRYNLLFLFYFFK